MQFNNISISHSIFAFYMEEIQNSLVNKSPKNNDKDRIVQQAKINQLHDLIQGYLNNVNRKKIEAILPSIDKIKSDIDQKQKQIQSIKSSKLDEMQLLAFYEQRRCLTQELKALSKKLQTSKNQSKKMKIKRKEVEQQLKKNEQMYEQLQTKNRLMHSNKSENTLVKSAFPRISGFNYDLHLANPTKRITASLFNGTNTSRSGQKSAQQKQCFYNSINFQRLKQIEKLLDQITIQSSTFKFEKALIGNTSQSIVKKVFRKFSINQFFDQFLQKKYVHKFLLDIEKS